MTDPTSCEKCGKPHVRCSGHIKSGPRQGEPCMQPPMRGQRICRKHGGKAPQNLKAAEMRIRDAEAREAVQQYGLAVDVSPTDALLQEVRWTAGHVAWLRERVQEVEERQLTHGITEQKIDPEGGKTVTIKTAPGIWLDLYQRERRHLVDVCAAAVRAGVEERAIRLAERQGKLVADAIEGILADLQLTASQQERVPEIVPRHLRAITGGAGASA